MFAGGPPDWPGQDIDVMETVGQALRDGDWGKYHGKNCQRLADLLCQEFQCKYALLCSSGTIATEIALRACGVQANSEVMLAGYDFSGNFRAVESVQAMPVLIDIDPRTWCPDLGSLEEGISESTQAVIVSHLHGGLADMQRVRENTASRSIAVIEDACQVPGAVASGKPVGAFADAMTLSFGGSKLLTSGRGGAVLTNRADVFQRAKVFCERGNDAFPLSELQAAALLPQIGKLAARNAVRSANVRRIANECQAFWQINDQSTADGKYAPVFYKLPWLFDPPFEMQRESLIAALQAEGIAIDAGFRGFVNRSAKRCRKVGDLQHSQAAAEKTVLLHHPILLESTDQIQRLIVAIQRVYGYFQHQAKQT